ncbi:hypothetical protein A4R35_13765 [Thermogemmatispora tikiterensis]|uniref:DUF4870 domain-containing protein n=2 Tax=Thermogemmatispora tikiterensis TaxID=1825093 RepID=A0A328VHU9_9CHLR|nr:hypothetical protein A4R35_13765 [Thermogemmatispora tikiterensis]
MTTLGLDERLERALAYALFWISGLILFLVEKNRNVRWHAAQSLVTFGALSLAVLLLQFLHGLLSLLPLLGWLIGFGLSLLINLLGWLMLLLWLWLMLMAWLRPDYRLPFFSRLADSLV